MRSRDIKNRTMLLGLLTEIEYELYLYLTTTWMEQNAIAKKLYKSPVTIKKQSSILYGKLWVANRIELLVKYYGLKREAENNGKM